jgi:hypothetical protein
VRIGDTVRRPLRPFGLTVQEASGGWAPPPDAVWGDAGHGRHGAALSRGFASLGRAGSGVPKLWEDGDKDQLPRAEAWLIEGAPAITARPGQPG